MPRSRRQLKVYAGSGNIVLASSIAQGLGATLTPSGVARFSDGETFIGLGGHESVAGSTVVAIQSCMPSGNERLMEMLLLLDALKRLKPKRLLAVFPFFPYRRSGKEKPGEAIGSELVARCVEAAGATRVVLVDPHSSRLVTFFKIPVETVTAMNLFIDEWKTQKFLRPLVVAQDRGAVQRAQWVASELGGETIAFEKQRGRADEVQSMAMNPAHAARVSGATCCIIDDEINAAGTLMRAIAVLVSAGAREIHVAATHAIFSGPAIERLGTAPISSLMVTDSIGFGPEKRLPNMKVLSVAPLLVKALKGIIDGRRR